MKFLNNLGTFLIFIGVIFSSISAARIPPAWGYFSLFILLLTGGIIIKKVGKKRSAKANSEAGKGVSYVYEVIKEMEREVKNLNDKKKGLTLDEIHEKLEEILTRLVYDFVEFRNSITDSFGLTEYSHVMSPFATAERYLNRAWSSSADNYRDETLNNIELAVPYIVETEEELGKLIEREAV